MTYAGRKKQLGVQNTEETLIGLIMQYEKGNKSREKYLKKLDKKHLIQIMLSIEFGNTLGFEPIEIDKKSKKTKKEQDDEDYS